MVVPSSVMEDICNDDVSALSRWLDGAPGRVNEYDEGLGCGWPYSLLMLCAERDATICARYLIARGADVNERNPNPDTINLETDKPSLITALHVAVEGSRLLMIALLTEAGADVDARMYNGRTPLGKVLVSLRQSDRYPVVKALLRAGASIDMCGMPSRTAEELLEEGTRGGQYYNGGYTSFRRLLRDVRAAGS